MLLSGYELQNSYKVSFGLFGTVGYADTYLKKQSDKYQIKVKVKTKGMAKFISNNRREVYESFGEIKDGSLLPLEYKKTKTTNRYTKIKRYVFDHENKKVTLYKESVYYDVKNELLNDEYVFNNTKKDEKTKEVYKFYAKNDILSLYFNLINEIKEAQKDNFTFKAVGAKENNGLIEIIKPKAGELASMKKFMNLEKDHFLKVIINQDIFTSSKGEMLINIDDKNICSKAILKDVLLFGDIIATKVN